MKQSLIIFLMLASLFVCSASFCKKKVKAPMISSKITLKINSKTFTATLLDNNSANEFKKMIPLAVKMIELNGNEKYFDLPKKLPINSTIPDVIHKGDLMLFGSKTLVLFYKSSATKYSYTRLGSIDDVTGLGEALGTENANITFEIE